MNGLQFLFELSLTFYIGLNFLVKNLFLGLQEGYKATFSSSQTFIHLPKGALR